MSTCIRSREKNYIATSIPVGEAFAPGGTGCANGGQAVDNLPTRRRRSVRARSCADLGRLRKRPSMSEARTRGEAAGRIHAGSRDC